MSGKPTRSCEENSPVACGDLLEKAALSHLEGASDTRIGAELAFAVA